MVNKGDARGKTGCITLQFIRKTIETSRNFVGSSRNLQNCYVFLLKNINLLKNNENYINMCTFSRNWRVMHPVLPRASPLFTVYFFIVSQQDDPRAGWFAPAEAENRGITFWRFTTKTRIQGYRRFTTKSLLSQQDGPPCRMICPPPNPVLLSVRVAMIINKKQQPRQNTI